MLIGQAIRHTQPQGQRAIIGNCGHTQLATSRLIPAAQHEELVAAGILPVPAPLFMTGVAIGLQVMLLAPQPLRPETQPYQPSRDVGLQHCQFGFQVCQPPPLLVNLLPPTLLLGLRNLLFPWSNSPLQAVHPQPLRRPHRRHLAVQRHPHRVEQPRRYPVLTDVVALQRRCRPFRRDFSKQLALHLAVQLSIGCQRGISRLTVQAHIAGDASLIGGGQWTLSRIQASGCSMVSAAKCHDYIIPERAQR